MKVVNRPRSWNFNIEGAPDSGVSVLGPDLSDGLTKLNITDIEFSDGLSIEGAEIIEGRPEPIDIKTCVLKRSVFKNILFIESSVKKLDVNSVRFEHCDFSNAAFGGAVIHRAEFVNCKMLGTNLTEAVLRNVSFKDCKCDYAFFSFANFKQVKFDKCGMVQSDFQRAVLSKFAFLKCNLTASQFSGVSMRGLDISDCEIEGIIAGADDLKGAVISSHQAIQLAAVFGLTIKF